MANTYRTVKQAPQNNSGGSAVGDYEAQYSTDDGTTWNPLFSHRFQNQTEATDAILKVTTDEAAISLIAPTVTTQAYS